MLKIFWRGIASGEEKMNKMYLNQIAKEVDIKHPEYGSVCVEIIATKGNITHYFINLSERHQVQELDVKLKVKLQNNDRIAQLCEYR